MLINKSKLWIGVISSLLFIILKFINGVYEYEVAIDKSFDNSKQLIFTIAHFYLYISILFILKNVLIDFYKLEFLKKNLSWIIKLNAISASLLIMIVLGFGKYLAVLGVILLLLELIFYIRFFRDIMSIDENTIPAISELQRFAKAILIVLILGTLFSMAIQFAAKPELQYLNHLILVIPFIYISSFFFKTLKTIYQ